MGASGRARRLGKLLATLTLLGMGLPLSTAWAQAEQCYTYRTSYSWSQTRTFWGNSATEVCATAIAAEYPRDLNDKRIFATPGGIHPIANYPGAYYCVMHRTGIRLGGPYDGYPLPEETMTLNVDGVASQYCIELSGGSSTTALPAGPALPHMATVRGENPAGRTVSIQTRAGSISGVTDGGGVFNFTYVPPSRTALTDRLEASCGGCGNSAVKFIEVQAGETCKAPQ